MSPKGNAGISAALSTTFRFLSEFFHISVFELLDAKLLHCHKEKVKVVYY